MKERIQKLLSARGIASRRQAEQMILAGRVCCNGIPCILGQTADPAVDEITVDGKPLPSAKAYIYIMLHKPRGYVTTLSDEKGRKNVSMLVFDCGRRVYPVGRLDMDSEGMLLLTDDGEFANRLMHPSHQVDKEYHVTVRGYSPEALLALGTPVVLDGKRIAPPRIRLLQANGERAEISVVIHEGRNRQVRRMCAKAGMQVKRLVRVREGSVRLGELPVGRWRYLTEAEVKELLHE